MLPRPRPPAAPGDVAGAIGRTIGIEVNVVLVVVGAVLIRKWTRLRAAEMQPTETGPTKRPARRWRIVLAALVFLALIGNSVQHPLARGDVAEESGGLFGIIVMLALGIWLLGTGLPKTISPPEVAKIRRRIWLLLVGVGFLVMLVGTILAFSIHQPEWAGAVVLETLVFGYWFGWTWIAWLIADNAAVRRIHRRRNKLPLSTAAAVSQAVPQASSFCSACGKYTQGTVAFCAHCGTKISA
jgi:hypothetical protein